MKKIFHVHHAPAIAVAAKNSKQNKFFFFIEASLSK